MYTTYPRKVDATRESEFAGKLAKHTAIGVAAMAAARVLWKVPIINIKTLEQTSDLILPETERKEGDKSKVVTEENYFRGAATEGLYQLAQFVLNRSLWHSKSLNLLGLFSNNKEHNALSIITQAALTSTLTYPLLKIRTQQAVKLPEDALGKAYSDYSFVQKDAFLANIAYNVAVHLGTFLIEPTVRGYLFSNVKATTPAMEREHGTWSYYLSLTFMRVLFNPLEIYFKKKIVEDSATVVVKEIKDDKNQSPFWTNLCKWSKGAIFTIPETLFSGLLEFYTYRVMNRAIPPHSTDE